MTAQGKRSDILIGAVTGDMPTMKGEGLVPLRMDPPGTEGGLEPISFALGLDPITQDLLRDGLVVSSHPTGEQKDLETARKRASALGHLF